MHRIGALLQVGDAGLDVGDASPGPFTLGGDSLGSALEAGCLHRQPRRCVGQTRIGGAPPKAKGPPQPFAGSTGVPVELPTSFDHLSLENHRIETVGPRIDHIGTVASRQHLAADVDRSAELGHI